ncbi:hypothetical protein ACQP2Y_12725 [Actinoplanes sp. CA-051413]|uniref:hypothetical protein n=1 Tax=Actinoplanes sp. CA-051413 TaxID=3239899 RepID=UPI003D96746E
MGPVQLMRASAGMRPSGTGSFSYYANADIVVDNMAYHKSVGVWGRQTMGGVWVLFPGTYQRSLPTNREQWTVHIAIGPIDRFAVRYDAAGSTHWDNNAGNDYFLDAAAAQQQDGVGTAVITSPVQVPAYSQVAGSQDVTLVVQNLSYVKQVGIRRTTDNWQTYRDITATYVKSYPPTATPAQPSAEYWEATVAPTGGAHGEFVAFYRDGNTTYWDNDFNQNFHY